MADSFSNKTLNQNWFERRLLLPQQQEDYKDERFSRQNVGEDGITSMYCGIPNSMISIKRTHKWDTSQILKDDGFRERETTVMMELDNPKNHKDKEINTCNLVVKENMREMLPGRRELVGPESGFGSKMQKHDPDHEKRFFATSNKAFFGEEKTKSSKEYVEEFKKTQNIQAGSRVKSQVVEPTRVAMCAEKLKITPEEPQRDTACNKTWIGYTDPSLTAMNKGIPNATLPYDIGNSLPMGAGVHAQMKKSSEIGAYRKQHSEVTIRDTAPKWNYTCHH